MDYIHFWAALLL